MKPPSTGKPGTARRWLVLGYGNALRGDDGAGPELAARVAAWNLPEVTALAVPQLTPELAAHLAGCDGVVFVDARAGGEEVELTPLRVEPQPADPGHLGRPAGLLALAHSVYGATPAAWVLTMPGVEFGLGTKFSPVTRAALDAAEARLRTLLAADRGM